MPEAIICTKSEVRKVFVFTENVCLPLIWGKSLPNVVAVLWGVCLFIFSWYSYTGVCSQFRYYQLTSYKGRKSSSLKPLHKHKSKYFTHLLNNFCLKVNISITMCFCVCSLLSYLVLFLLGQMSYIPGINDCLFVSLVFSVLDNSSALTFQPRPCIFSIGSNRWYFIINKKTLKNVGVGFILQKTSDLLHLEDRKSVV